MKVDKAQLLEMFFTMPNEVQEMGCAQVTQPLGDVKFSSNGQRYRFALSCELLHEGSPEFDLVNPVVK